MTFSSQYGTVNLGSLPVVMRNGQDVSAAPASAPAASAGDVFAAIERLGELRAKGLLTEQEFATKKAELLGRL
jgi:hypothetical protein